MPRKNRRAPQPELPIVLPDFGATVTGLWAITMTNGSSQKVVEVYGTKASAWDWAEAAGAQGGIAPGYWLPRSITSAANVVSQDPFLVVA
jgi:hypothetical protein